MDIETLNKRYYEEKRGLFLPLAERIVEVELKVFPHQVRPIKQQTDELGHVLYLPPEKFRYAEGQPDVEYVIRGVQFFHKDAVPGVASASTEQTLAYAQERGFNPLNVEMLIALLRQFPQIIDYFNYTCSTWTDSGIHTRLLHNKDDDDKYYLSAYNGHFASGEKVKWRRDRNDVDPGFVIPAYKKELAKLS